MKDLICIVCPKGCRLTVDDQNGYAVTGNTCPRGEVYGRNELENPVRVVTSTVRISGASQNRCPVKTNAAVAKNKVKDIMKVLDDVKLNAPVKVGDIAVENILNTGADVVVTKNMPQTNK